MKEEKVAIERRLMSVKQVAAYLGITPSTCYAMVRKGVLKPVQIPLLERVLFDRGDIERLVEESKCVAHQESNSDK